VRARAGWAEVAAPAEMAMLCDIVFSSTALDAWIKHRLHDVDQEIDHDEQQREDENRALKDRQIPREDRAVEKEAGAGPGEDRFDQDRSSEQLRELQAGNREHRRSGVLCDVKQDA